MQVKTLLNACHRIKGFVYAAVRFERVKDSIVVEVRQRQQITAGTNPEFQPADPQIQHASAARARLDLHRNQ